MKNKTALTRPSSLKYWLACPMFKYRETDDIVKAADQGTENHALLQNYLKTPTKGMILRDYIAKLTAANRPAVIEYALDQVRGFLQGYDVDKRIIVCCEQKTNPIFGVNGGSADFVARIDTTALIILDWKFVYAEPEADDAYYYQLMSYAASIINKLKKQNKFNQFRTRVTLAAVCPNLRKTFVYADRESQDFETSFELNILPEIRANEKLIKHDPFTCRWNKFCPKCERAANRTCGIALAHAIDPAMAPDATDGRAILDKAKLLKAMADDMKAKVLEREQAAPGTTGAKLRSRTIPPKPNAKRFLTPDDKSFVLEKHAQTVEIVNDISQCNDEELALLIEYGYVNPSSTSQYVQ